MFLQSGFAPEMLGQNLIDRCSVMWRSKANRPEDVGDIRKENSGRTRGSQGQISR